MANTTYQLFSQKKIIQILINFLFISFIFLFGLKIDNFQIRFLILALLIPSIIQIINEYFKKDFRKILLIFSFSLLIIFHSIINIFFESANYTMYNFSGILLIILIFIISLYFYENFNKNITTIIKLFLLIFFISIIVSIFNFKNDSPYFCGGIPDLFGIIKFYEKYTPSGIIIEHIPLHKIGEMKFSFREYLFPENSHLGMIAPGIIVYLLHQITTNKEKKIFQLSVILFIFICIVKSSTTFLLGTIISLIVLILFNFKNLNKNSIIAFISIILILGIILFSSKECRSRFVPSDNSLKHTLSESEKNLKENDYKISNELKKFLNTSGSLSSDVYFRALIIAKQSIIEKPFGWGINRYDIAFDYFNKRNPPNIHRLKTYNNKDGTNNFVKLVVEIGLFAFILYLFFFLFLINKLVPVELKLFYIPFVITQSLRGAGYFYGGFSLIVFLMILTYFKFNKKYL